MINPADLKRMLAHAHATQESAQNSSDFAANTEQAHIQNQDSTEPDISAKHQVPTPSMVFKRSASAEHPESAESSATPTLKAARTLSATPDPQTVQKSSDRSEQERTRITPAVMRQQIEMAYSSHYSSGYFMDDEEYLAEYDIELNDNGETFAHFSSISSSIVPLYTTSSKSADGAIDAHDARILREFVENGFVENQSHSKDAEDSKDNSDENISAPTPAIMAKKREDGPLTFASLDNRDLPVVREYSAGGLVFDDHDRVAIITRHSRSGHVEWCLPKGHIEKGETSEETAVREIFEETGIKGEVIDSIATIDYWFTGDAQRIHKLVHHYALRMTGGYLTVEGDPDHEAEDATWVKFDDLTDVLSYPNERRIVWLYAKKRKREA